ncbi:flagellar basal body rod modification protein FlgD [Azorhizobium oxalatiphilum]|uniref:Basal-body rod modification protein FlgD n=1 Tax=Azorhizobium oxalatiphilum TaxID=980631 RepID=A0A917BKU6_9HYPH|nr:flagellar hook assembly protein FlgD [Azorhizobium oxalatiphilum]GGF47936.1 flagellar basal body rod modification protein FlgD [Azorhizobium oxalatiphilum]
MTTVSSVNSTTTTTTSSTTASQNTVDYNQFLQLLVAQLKNQDPTEPMDSTQYLSQLASFSQVEAQTNTNNKLDTLLTSTALQTADSAIGRTVTSADGSVSGVVKSVTLVSGSNPVATLADGTTLTLDSGVTISG